MNWIDIACLACLLIFGAIGLWRGLLSSIFRLCAWIAAILGAYFAQDLFGDYVMRNFAFGDFAAHLICTCVGFLVPFLLFTLIGHVVGDSISKTVVGKANRILGCVFGLVKATIICFVFLTIMHLLPVEGDLRNLRNDAVAYNLYKTSLETMGYSSDEVNLRKMAKEKASELTKTITEKATNSTEQAADSAKAAVKDVADSVANKVSETAEKAKDAAIAAKDAALKTFEEGKSSASKDSSSSQNKTSSK